MVVCLPIMSILGSESDMINFYILNTYLTALTIVGAILLLKNHYCFSIGKIEIVVFCILCFSFASNILNGYIFDWNLYCNLFVSLLFVIVSKILIFECSVDFRRLVFLSIIIVNVILLLSFFFLDNNDFANHHLGNVSVASVLLSISVCVIIYECVITSRRNLFMYILIIAIDIYYIYIFNSRTAYFVIIFFILGSSYCNRRIKILVIGTLLTLFIFSFACNDVKENSAFGRMFIYENSMHLVVDNLIDGTGGFGSFSYAYPIIQAKYFAKHMEFDTNYMLADNVMYAYNEYLQVLCEIGFIGVVLLGILLFQIRKALKADRVFYSVLFMPLAVSALFLYTFHIAIFCSLLLLCIVYAASFQKSKDGGIGVLKLPCLMVCMAIILYNIKHLNEALIVRSDLEKSGMDMVCDKINILNFVDNKKLLYMYASLYSYKGKNDDFMEKMNVVSSKFLNSDLVCLEACNLIEMKKYDIAKEKLILASNICPNRFRYRYVLFKMLLETGQVEEAKCVAKFINDMPVKIHSPVITAIKLEVNDFLSNMQK